MNQLEVYMLFPEGASAPEPKVCRLKKALYGLRQEASPQWFLKLSQALKWQGYAPFLNDHFLSIKHSGSLHIIPL